MNILDQIKEINTLTLTASRDGYQQYFKEVGSTLTHYIVRLSDGVKSKEASYVGIAKLDNFVSVSCYYADKEGIYTTQEFVDMMAG